MAPVLPLSGETPLYIIRRKGDLTPVLQNILPLCRRVVAEGQYTTAAVLD